MNDYDEEKLPKWAQERLEICRNKIDRLQYKLEETEKAHAILYEHENWLTVQYPDLGAEYTSIFCLMRNRAQQICSLGNGDILLIGRKTPKRTTNERVVRTPQEIQNRIDYHLEELHKYEMELEK